MKYTARYDPATGEIRGIFKGVFLEAENSIAVSQEVVDDPHQYRFDGEKIVKKTQQEIDEIMASRQKWLTKKEREKNTLSEVDGINIRLDALEQRLLKAGL